MCQKKFLAKRDVEKLLFGALLGENILKGNKKNLFESSWNGVRC
jgi:hypothetical protein